MEKHQNVGLIESVKDRIREYKAAFPDLQFTIEEIFAVEVLANCRFPEILGFQQETIQGTYIIPPQ